MRGRNPRSILKIAYILGADVLVWLAAILIVGLILILLFSHRGTDNMLHPHLKTCQTRILYKLTNGKTKHTPKKQ
jgi:hypothetical protein